MTPRAPTFGLPPDLLAVLRDQSIIVPQDAAVFELIHAWQKAPCLTASAKPHPPRAHPTSLTPDPATRPSEAQPARGERPKRTA